MTRHYDPGMRTKAQYNNHQEINKYINYTPEIIYYTKEDLGLYNYFSIILIDNFQKLQCVKVIVNKFICIIILT